MTTTESKCHDDKDCENVKLPCPGPLACLYGGCVCMTTTESKCHDDKDCENVKLPCPGPLACLYGGCVCTYLDKPLDIPNSQIKSAHSGKKVINLHDSSV
ncbi:hypothetical protein HID58_076319 [Brassica napus]|uniref:Defensin-like protein n=1 Tax=Brassica napus TaxID=3708 RepID=A0ABQ7YM49_BRANA|nr:hypothetical protein HID58_076319 [Brassica napus]